MVPDGEPKYIPNIGIIPNDWNVFLASKVCTKITDGTHDKPKTVNFGVPYITAIHIKDGRIDFNNCQYVSKEDHEIIYRRCNPEKGDLLVVNIGAGVAECGFVDTDIEFSMKNVALLKPNRSILDDTFLLHQYLFRKDKIAHITKVGGAQPFLSLRELGKLIIIVPPLPEQKKIARILSTWDKAIETVKKLIENSKAQKKALMQQLLTGKRRLPGFDEEWKTIRLDDVLDGKKRKGKIVPTNDEKRGVAYIGSTSFNGDFGIYTDSSDAVICSPKDILVLWDGENAGKATTGLSGAVSSTVVRCRIDESKANSRFITYNLLKDNYKVRAIREGSGIPHMPGDFEHWYHINLPPLKEQQEIAAILTSTDKEIETLQQKLDYLKQEKKSLMQQILTGKRRVIIN